MNKQIIFALTATVLVIGGVWYYMNTKPVMNNIPPTTLHTTPSKNPTATIVTNKGTIVVELYSLDAPKTVANFIKLADAKFYDGLTFHRVIAGFMIQGGDPNCTASRAAGMCGAGGPGYQFADELNSQTPSYQAGYQRGVLAMANAGPNTNGSQFFIMHADYSLDHNYTIFGRVLSGLDVVDTIATTNRDSNDRPTTPVVMEHVTISQ